MERQSHRVSVRTPASVRLAIKESSESVRALARRYNLNPKTVQKWKHRDGIDDKCVAKKSISKLSLAQENIIAGFRLLTQLPLDDCLYALEGTIPHLTRSSLHRCLQRRGLSKLAPPPREASQDVVPELGHFETVCVPAAAEDGPFIGLVASDVATRILFGRIYGVDELEAIARFPEALAAFLPYSVKSLSSPFFQTGNSRPRFIWTGGDFVGPDGTRWRDNFADLPHLLSGRQAPDPYLDIGAGPAIYHRVHDARGHMASYNLNYNCARRFKTIGGLKPHDYLCKLWKGRPDLFHTNPRGHFEAMMGCGGDHYEQLSWRLSKQEH